MVERVVGNGAEVGIVGVFLLAEFEPDFRPRGAVFEEFLDDGVLKSERVGLVGEIDGAFFVVKFTLEVTFKFVTGVGEFGFGGFLVVKFGE